MIEGLRHLIERIKDASLRTYAMSQEISASTEEFAASTTQLSQNTQEIALAAGEVEKLSSRGYAGNSQVIHGHKGCH